MNISHIADYATLAKNATLRANSLYGIADALRAGTLSSSDVALPEKEFRRLALEAFGAASELEIKAGEQAKREAAEAVIAKSTTKHA